MKRCLLGLGLVWVLATAVDGVAEDLAAQGWRLWLDPAAAWTNDALYLPDEVDLARLPVNPPTGGWDVLNDLQGQVVNLPTTVEASHWGRQGLRPYRDAYCYEASDPAVSNGCYTGVSWWWRRFMVPTVKPGQRLVVTFRGARLRAEVYCNGRLCGYSILGELPFEADVTEAAQPFKENVLAVRLTNPGGRFDWRDSVPFQWGRYTLPATPGFGGLDAGITLNVRDNVAVRDLAVQNQPEPRRVKLVAEVVSQAKAWQGAVTFRMLKGSKVVWEGRAPGAVDGGGTAHVTIEACLDRAELWDLDHPVLYRAEAQLSGVAYSGLSTSFGFRWFTPAGLGEDARLELNGRRIVIRSANSCGFWGANGLWPDAALAEREVTAARALGLNALQAHRHLAKSLVLDAQDRLGLLRYEEPGAGWLALQGDDAFAARYATARILAMVRRDRSHPALVAYCVQNELAADLGNPRIATLLRAMHALDPGRLIVLKSGIAPVRQAFMLPGDASMHADDGTGRSGWWDQHNVAGPGNYTDGLYTSPVDFAYRATNRQEVVVWGEMAGVGTPDDHAAIVAAYRTDGRTGYDRADRERVLAAYEAFLDAHRFRGAFRTASDLFQTIGAKSYAYWQKLIENGRMSDAVDYLVLGNWESTTIENHAGLVDAHRGFKSDPAIVRAANEPNLLIVRPRHYIVPQGGRAVVDVHLINEAGTSGLHTLNLSAADAQARVVLNTTVVVRVQGGRVYGQLLREHVAFAVPAAGYVTLTATLKPPLHRGLSLTRRANLLVVDPVGPALPPRVAVVEPGEPVVAAALVRHWGVEAVGAARLKEPLDAVVLAGATAAAPADDPVLRLLPGILPRVLGEGLRLVIWTDTGAEAERFAAALDKLGALTCRGRVGGARAPWMGAWQFLRPSWLLDGLPSDGVMDWRYQVTTTGDEDGLLLTAPGMDVAAGYGRDHDDRVGVALCAIPYGRGDIVIACLPGLRRALAGEVAGIAPPVALRLLGNALRPR